VSERVPPVGTLTDRVTLKRRELVEEGGGGHASLLVPLGNAWARVRSHAGREGQSADGRVVVISHTVVLRFRRDLGPGDRIIYRGQPLEVVSAGDLNGKRAFLSCACTQLARAG
jgi:SPP1 family predicted phage head-tail adaptor